MPSSEVTIMPEAGRPDTTKTLNLAGGLNLEEIKSIGTAFFQSGMFRDTKSAAQAITKVLAGQELGIPPMMAMRGIHVVDGNPQLSAGLIAALVKRSGRYDYRLVEANDSVCVLEWRQRTDQGGWETVGQSDFTREEAAAAGLDKKTNWRTYTEDMLFARALTRGARRYCPDVFGGAVYTLGEAAAEAEDLPAPFIQQTGGYKPPRVATLHEESRPDAAGNLPSTEPDAPASGSSSAAPSALGEAPGETSLFPPSQDELDALEADQHRDQHRDPAA